MSRPDTVLWRVAPFSRSFMDSVSCHWTSRGPELSQRSPASEDWPRGLAYRALCQAHQAESQGIPPPASLECREVLNVY